MLVRCSNITAHKRRDSPEISKTHPSFDTAGSNLWQDFSALASLHRRTGLALLPFACAAETDIHEVQNFLSDKAHCPAPSGTLVKLIAEVINYLASIKLNLPVWFRDVNL